MAKWMCFMLLNTVFLVTACTASSSPATGVPRLAVPAESSSSMEQIAAAGQTVFTNNCARCHGNRGQGALGPAIIGANARLEKYHNAQGLLDFISKAMPANAPGSLSAQQYAEAVSFLLVQNEFTPGEAAFDHKQLKEIVLNKSGKSENQR